MFYSLEKHQAKITVVFKTRNSLICTVVLVWKLYHMHERNQGSASIYRPDSTAAVQSFIYSSSRKLVECFFWKACYDGDIMLFTVK